MSACKSAFPLLMKNYLLLLIFMKRQKKTTNLQSKLHKCEGDERHLVGYMLIAIRNMHFQINW